MAFGLADCELVSLLSGVTHALHNNGQPLLIVRFKLCKEWKLWINERFLVFFHPIFKRIFNSHKFFLIILKF